MAYKVLIVENNEGWQFAIKESVSNHYTDTANNYETAIEKLNSKEYDFVILNINIKDDFELDKYGIRLLTQLEEIEYPAKVIIITQDKDVTLYTFNNYKNVSEQFIKKHHVEMDNLEKLKNFLDNTISEPYIRHSPCHFRTSTVGIHLINNRNYKGTGCICSYSGKRFIITCAHLLKDIDKDCGLGSTFEIFPFGKTSESKLMAEVIYFNPPIDKKYDLWNSEQDIALLSLPKNNNILFHSLRINDHVLLEEDVCECKAFGYSQSLYGHDVKEIKLGGILGKGFQKLEFPKNHLKPGDSGSPVFHDLHGFIGIFSSKLNDQEGYIIPKMDIINTLKELQP